MTALLQWITNQFKYFVFGTNRDSLILHINHIQGQIPEQIKDNLIQSIICNQPNEFVKQLNAVPENIKAELMSSLLKINHEGQPTVIPNDVNQKYGFYEFGEFQQFGEFVGFAPWVTK